MFDLPPGTDRHAYSYAASPVGLGIVAASAAASLLPFGTLVAWVFAVSGSVAVILATEQGHDDFPSPARLRELPGLPLAVARGLLATAFAAAPLFLLLLLSWLAARAPEEQALESAVTHGASIAFLAFFVTVHAWFPALLTATLDPAPFAALHRAHRKQVAGNLFLLHALAYAGLFVLFFVRTMVHFLPEALQGALTAAAFAYLHLAFSRLAASASRSHRRAFEEGAGG
jgi:hypothetical protein